MGVHLYTPLADRVQ